MTTNELGNRLFNTLRSLTPEQVEAVLSLVAGLTSLAQKDMCNVTGLYSFLTTNGSTAEEFRARGVVPNADEKSGGFAHFVGSPEEASAAADAIWESIRSNYEKVVRGAMETLGKIECPEGGQAEIVKWLQTANLLYSSVSTGILSKVYLMKRISEAEELIKNTKGMDGPTRTAALDALVKKAEADLDRINAQHSECSDGVEAMIRTRTDTID